MVSAEQYIGHSPAAKLDRTRVLRALDEPAGKTVVGRAIFVPEHTRQEAHDGIGEDRGGERTIGQDVISDGDFIVDEMVDDTLVDALIMPAKKDEMRPGLRVLRGSPLVKAPP